MSNLYRILEDAICYGDLATVQSERIVRTRIKKLVRACMRDNDAIKTKKNIIVLVYDMASSRPLSEFYGKCLQSVVGKRLIYASVHHHVIMQGRVIVVLVVD